jgi:hypothetical protein
MFTAGFYIIGKNFLSGLTGKNSQQICVFTYGIHYSNTTYQLVHICESGSRPGHICNSLAWWNLNPNLDTG